MGEIQASLQVPGKEGWKIQGDHMFPMEQDSRAGRSYHGHRGDKFTWGRLGRPFRDWGKGRGEGMCSYLRWKGGCWKNIQLVTLTLPWHPKWSPKYCPIAIVGDCAKLVTFWRRTLAEMEKESLHLFFIKQIFIFFSHFFLITYTILISLVLQLSLPSLLLRSILWPLSQACASSYYHLESVGANYPGWRLSGSFSSSFHRLPAP